MADVVVVDYGLGNLFNLQRALEAVGCKSIISEKPDDFRKANRLLLPGVGAFGAGMSHLQEAGALDAVLEFAASGRPLLGICLGMQLLVSESEELGLHKGLDLIPGRATRFKADAKVGICVPQISWNAIFEGTANTAWADTLLRNVAPGSYMYFVHSYKVKVDRPDFSLAETVYGEDRFSSVIARDNVVGCQFHPELSGPVGLSILRSFVAG